MVGNQPYASMNYRAAETLSEEGVQIMNNSDPSVTGCPFPHDSPVEDWNPEGIAGGDEIIAELKRLRTEAPVAWTNAKGGYWTVTRFQDISAAARNTRVFSNVPRHPRIGTVYTPPLEADRPSHTAFRRLLNQFFTADYLESHTTWLRELADSMLVDLLEKDAARANDADGAGKTDWITQLCVPFPATVLCRLIGMPDSDWADLKKWTETSFRTLRDRDDDPVLFAEVNARINAYGASLIERARTEADRSDIISTLVHDPIASEQLSDEQIFGLVRLLLQAGHSTTAMGLANCLARLAEDQELQLYVREHPERLRSVVQEILRVDTPVLANVRRVTEDTVFQGRQLRQDDHLFLAWGSGNLDDSEVLEPGIIDPDRPATLSLTFGHGIHKCPGMPLALLEITTMLERFIANTVNFQTSDTPVRKRWEANGVSSLRLSISR